jgi:iron complex outermembrane receptor protein
MVHAQSAPSSPDPTTQPSAAPASGQAQAPNVPETAPAKETNLEEIVVTARKRSESIQDIPATVQAIPASVIKDAHMTQLDDIGSVVSNINIFQAHDNTPAVSMRGVGTFEVVQGVGFYMNDVQLYEGQTVRPNDIARIEVLKGPQGTLYGGANIGGAIKYVTKDPTQDWENQATIELGQYKTADFEGIISGPISDKLGVRISLYDENQGGYITDSTYNERLGASQDRGGRIVLLAEPDRATNVRLSFNFDDLDSANENLQYLVNENVFGPAYQYGAYTADAYTYTVADFFHPSYDRKLYSTTIEADHQFDNGVQLTSITNQFWSYNRGLTDLIKRSFPVDLLSQNIDNRVVSEELRLASTAHSNLDWLVGVYVQQHKTITQNGDKLYNMEFPPPCAPCYGLDSYWGYDSDLQQLTAKQYSIFGDTTYYVGDWQVEVGLRAENYTSALNALNQPPPAPLANPNSPPAPPSPVQPEPAQVVMPTQSLSRTALSPRFSVQYKLSADTNLYGTYAHGFTPAQEVEQPNPVTGPFLSSMRPEVASSFELGAKTRFANGGHLNAAVFFMNYKDRQYQSMIAQQGQFFDINTNIGDSRNSGIELDFALPVSQEFKLSGGFGTTRAVWGSAVYLDPQQTGINGVATYVNLQGKRAPFTPDYTANLALEWSHTLGDGQKVGARIDGTAVGESYWDPNDYARQKPYQLMNAGVSYDTKSWSWLAHVANVTGTKFNTMYWDAWDVGVRSSFGRIDRPRTATLSATYRF